MDKTTSAKSARRITEPRPGAQAIRRALAVLRILAAGREDGVPLAEVVRATGLTRPTVHRIVHVLIEEGIVERHDKTGRYAIGNQVPELALARARPSRLLIAANPSLQRASTDIGDTLFLTRRPLGVSSAGVAILAAMPAQEARKIVAANEKRLEAYRTDAATVLGQVTAARRLGYGMREIGLVQGTKSISTWIKTPDGRPAAAMTVSAVRTRLGPRREQEVAEILLREARAIEQAIRGGGA
jgi:DNA-binding IclR family transcriptional regulator